MNEVLKVVLSLSFSGSLLILVLLLCRPLLRDRVSKRWQYYIWLVVIARLLLPVTPQASPVGRLFRGWDQRAAISLAAAGPEVRSALPSDSGPAAEGEETAAPSPYGSAGTRGRGVRDAVVQNLWLIWLGTALAVLVRKVTAYQSFVSCVRAGREEVADAVLLDRLAELGRQAGVRRPVELCVNGAVSSPMLLGVIRPCIVLPCAGLPEEEFRCTVLHELVHCRRMDICYKWLVQLTICLHWFNPLVWLMGREVSRACELSCDEGVLRRLDVSERQAYGDTLLHAMEAGGGIKSALASVTLHESAKLLKERLCAIMRFKKQSKLAVMLSLVLAGGLTVGAAAAGAYPGPFDAQAGPAAVMRREAQDAQNGGSSTLAARIERYYEADSLPLFEIAFARLEEGAQRKWLERLYADGEFALFSAAVRGFGADAPLAAEFAEKAYADEEIAFFSILADRMDERELEGWLERALEDGNWSFQSMLFDRLDRDGEFDKLEEKREKEWEEAQWAEYRAAGVVMDGKDYYCQGQLVNIFLDVRSDKSFYTLALNPAGTINIKIVRDADDKITGAVRMSDTEAAELLEDMNAGDDGDWADDRQEAAGEKIREPQVIPVHFEAAAAGETVFLGEYTLAEGDKIWYDVLAETGDRMKIFFTAGGQRDVAYWSVNNLRQPGETLECTAAFTVGPPAKPGTYQLYLQAPEGALGNVRGRIAVGAADKPQAAES